MYTFTEQIFIWKKLILVTIYISVFCDKKYGMSHIYTVLHKLSYLFCRFAAWFRYFVKYGIFTGNVIFALNRKDSRILGSKTNQRVCNHIFKSKATLNNYKEKKQMIEYFDNGFYQNLSEYYIKMGMNQECIFFEFYIPYFQIYKNIHLIFKC